MRDPAAIENGGWVRRFVAHSGATAVALIGHLAILFALGYDAASEVIVGEPPAAITVEIVFAPADGARNVSDQSTAIEAENSETRAPVQPETTIEKRQVTDSLPAALTASMPAVVPLPVRKPSVRPTRLAEHQESSVRLRESPLALAPSHDVLEGSVAGAVGAGPALSDVPSSWKARLMSHLERYKRYPEAARTQRAEGTALLSFGMDRDGRVLGYSIVRSSGCPELDSEALAMIERASPLPPAPPEIRQQIVQLVVPVRFRM